jgi:hypothetical protein
MADTGAPWNLPYPLDTDLVKDGAQAIEDLAVAAAAGLDAAVGLVAVKTVVKTDTFSSSITSGGSAAVTGLSLTHSMADAANRLILIAFFGSAANSQTTGTVGIAINDGTNFLSVGAAAASRTQVTAGGQTDGAGSTRVVAFPHITIVHSPGVTTAVTYQVHVFNMVSATRTVYVNRSELDTNEAGFPRTASALHLMEVRV